mgnify:CR=1 FL=1
MAYKIYTSVNYADTCRDPDDIHFKDLGYKNELEDAIILANNYIKNHFFHKDTQLIEHKNGSFSATDFCSYGKTIIIEPIKID